jgi:threonine dehydratase
MFERARAVVEGAVVATLDEVAAAVRLLAERNRIVAEGAGACPVACALSGRTGPGPVVCIVSGGNIDLDRFVSVITGAG